MVAETVAYCESIKEDGFEKCSNGLDDDGNGFTDCNDFSCSRSVKPEVIAYCASIAENTVLKCTDQIDNDQNSYTDCEDNACTKATTTIAQEIAQIQAQIAMTTDAAAKANLEASLVTIQNIINSAQSEITIQVTRIQNRLIASTNEAEKQILNQLLTSLTASAVADLTVGAFCNLVVAEADFEKCTDQIDNDGDGFADCSDYSCRTATDIQTRQACQENAGSTTADAIGKCTDMLDNDNDGFTDCDDWDCSYHPDIVRTLTCPNIHPLTGEKTPRKICD
jgi:hypothetical protein